MYKLSLSAAAVIMLLITSFVGEKVYADDLSDGISEYTDESISSDDSIGSNKATNINYIVVEALGKSKAKRQKEGVDKSMTNMNDGTGDNNQNSVVVEAGSRVDKVYNIVIEK